MTEASLRIPVWQGQPAGHSVVAASSLSQSHRRCRLELELISRGIESPEQAADQLLRQLEAGR